MKDSLPRTGLYSAILALLLLPASLHAIDPTQIVYPRDNSTSYARMDALLSRIDQKPAKIEFLQTAINDKKLSPDDPLAADQLLHRFQPVSSIDDLIENIDAPQEVKSINKDAVEALVKIGEPAIPKLLKALEDFNDPRRQFYAVQAIARIKGNSYDSFLKDNYSTFSPRTQKAFATMSWQY